MNNTKEYLEAKLKELKDSLDLKPEFGTHNAIIDEIKVLETKLKNFEDKLEEKAGGNKKLWIVGGVVLLIAFFAMVSSAFGLTWNEERLPQKVDENGVAYVVPFHGHCSDADSMIGVLSGEVSVDEVLADGSCMRATPPVWVQLDDIDLDQAELVVNTHQGAEVYVVPFTLGDDTRYGWVPDFALLDE